VIPSDAFACVDPLKRGRRQGANPALNVGLKNRVQSFTSDGGRVQQTRLPAVGSSNIDQQLGRLKIRAADIARDDGDDGVRKPHIVVVGLDDQHGADLLSLAGRKPDRNENNVTAMQIHGR
jgi:hypothetical protein